MNNINKRKIVNEIFINEHNGKYQNYKHTHIHSYIYTKISGKTRTSVKSIKVIKIYFIFFFSIILKIVSENNEWQIPYTYKYRDEYLCLYVCMCIRIVYIYLLIEQFHVMLLLFILYFFYFSIIWSCFQVKAAIDK